VAHEPDAEEVRFGKRGRSPWSGEHEVWNVHAHVTVEQGDAAGRESLCFPLRRDGARMWCPPCRWNAVVLRAAGPRASPRSHTLRRPSAACGLRRGLIGRWVRKASERLPDVDT
jgi:hypothetical protein